jgi:hypothetical protein
MLGTGGASDRWLGTSEQNETGRREGEARGQWDLSVTSTQIESRPLCPSGGLNPHLIRHNDRLDEDRRPADMSQCIPLEPKGAGCWVHSMLPPLEDCANHE